MADMTKDKSTDAAPFTQRFTEWQCGHHGTIPSDIPVHCIEQAQACAQALAQAAVAQPDASRFVVVMATARVAHVPAGVRFASWAELAETVAQFGAFIATDELHRLADACTAQLATRANNARKEG